MTHNDSPMVGSAFSDTEDTAKERELVTENAKLATHSSVADELTKLSRLQKEGLLTDEEFKAQKAKLLV